MPKQKRPIVRDGRLQVRKKRTDRSYLRPSSTPADAPAEPDLEEGRIDAHSFVSEPAATTVSAASSTRRAPAAVRAIQQQGIRRRGEVDVDALLEADTRYAIHELRRIAVLATMVIITLAVLAVVLR